MVDELICQILNEMMGEDAVRIIETLSTPKTDTKIHELTLTPLTKIRTILNQLHQYNIVTYSSSRDDEKGWFKYVWELKEECLIPGVCSYLGSKLMRLKRQYQEINEVTYFKCERGCSRFEFNEAYEKNFKCNCGSIIKPIDILIETKAIKHEIETTKRVLKHLTAVRPIQNACGV